MSGCYYSFEEYVNGDFTPTGFWYLLQSIYYAYKYRQLLKGPLALLTIIM